MNESVMILLQLEGQLLTPCDAQRDTQADEELLSWGTVVLRWMAQGAGNVANFQ